VTVAAPELRPALAGRQAPQQAAELRVLAARLSDAADRFTSAAHRLGTRTAGLADGWTGEAAAAASLDLDALQQRALTAASAHVDASQVLLVCAARLDDAEATWQRAEALERQDARERAARATSAVIAPFEAESSPLRQQARRLADQAQAEADQALARAGAQLRDLADRAVAVPVARLTAADQVSGLGRGAVDAVWGSVITVAGLSLPRLLADPTGWREQVRGLRDGASYAVDHPGEAATAMVGWDLLQDGRYGEWAGGFVPDLLSGVFTGGALPIARRSADLADDLGDLADDVDDLQRVHGRGIDSNAGGPVESGPHLPAGYVTHVQDLTPERRRHILDGDPGGRGGGHRPGTGRPGKTEFPAHWTDDEIISRVMQTARAPQKVEWNTRHTSWNATCEFDGVQVVVAVDRSGNVKTAVPLKGGTGVVKNQW
jgi:hypothetical protein